MSNKKIKQQKRAEKKRIRDEERKNHRNEVQLINSTKVNINAIPYIIGADFQESGNSIDEIKSKISSLPKSNYKKRILFISEASYLKTGFATYTREVMKYLHNTNKYIIAEMACYGAPADLDSRAKSVPWKYYNVLPRNNIEEEEYRKDYRENQFGKWKGDYVFSDFKPDIVFCLTDNWMASWVGKHHLRGNFLWFWMPTVDGYPQKWEWLLDYSKVDKLFTYSWFGKKVLEEQSRTDLSKKINLPCLNITNVMQPGADINIFKPISKSEVKKTFGVPNNLRFVGTVMRNQPRKLFTRIIDSFRIFKENYPIQSKDVLLLLHTSIPDVGWDIPECVRQNGLDEYVVYSYMCSSCGLLAISNFCGSPTNCPSCGKNTFHTPNTQFGYKDENFAYIFNLMDVYIQGAVAEGDSMPVNEAKCCGIPCLVSDYSALYEKARNGGAMPIDNDTIYTESETMQWRSLFSREDLADKLAVLMEDDDKRSRMANQARLCGEKFYNWDLCVSKWEYEFDSVKIKDRTTTWDRPIEIKNMNKSSAPDLPNNRDGFKEWLTWCYLNILCRKGIDADGLQYWTRILENAQDKNKAKDEIEKHFRKMIEQENYSKMIISNPNMTITDPVERIRKQIEDIEK